MEEVPLSQEWLLLGDEEEVAVNDVQTFMQEILDADSDEDAPASQFLGGAINVDAFGRAFFFFFF